ncbi:HD domain-containing phosphohydrolase [Pseudoduganella namucuonensis]|uniref:Putative two-component system response regulator n=1 Tax=Pseudoduganella namucuonensis TaxID=1035707 RepID=A0A1I7EVL3_9BURK|nr:HD domain-containing phosphohydrolase [Pseudoduganella namucuonensis]SFU27963.1 putative two-component system response regulator [Pseudoduganella namucuonensis]
MSDTAKPAKRQPAILAVDDETTNLQLLRQILQERYRLLFAKDGPRALELAAKEQPDLILLDVMMPDMTGYEVCRRLKADPATSAIPVIFVTALTDATDEVDGFEAGAVDYITKPVSPAVVKARVQLHLSLVRMDELKASRLEIVRRLGLAAEYKDNETGLHVIRMSHYARMLGQAAGLDEDDVDDLFNAAPMHDIGKIGIPDRILQKPARLDPEEWAVMQTHPSIGADIIGAESIGMLAMAYDVARTHHEKWDGSGYPAGLRGEAIPLAGRIVAIADVFDALTSVRPYKQAWSVEQACDYLRAQRGLHFDPELVDLFLELMPQAAEVMEKWAER